MTVDHIMLQGKGGVGKSTVSSYLFQALAFQGLNVVGYDTDPVNNTLSGYEDFDVKRVEVMRDDEIDPRAFDNLIEELAKLPQNAHAIIDNGASSFLALSAYIRQNDVVSILQEQGHTLYFHTVITGGQAIKDTLSGLQVLAVNFPAVPLVVWLNPYFGEIKLGALEFEEFAVYQEYASQYHAIIRVPQGNRATLGRDLEELLAKRQSFAKAINSEKQTIAVRARLKRYWAELVSTIHAANLC